MALLFLSTAVNAQNTKGDKPVNNQRRVRETRVKSVKKKEKGTTRDVANRRLRTKDRSSANRANTKYPQPSPYSGRTNRQPDRSAQPLGRVFSKSPRESKVRAWKGDVSGYPLKRPKASRSEAARNNVYPQSGPYVRYARKQPKKRPPVYSRTIKGNPFVTHQPRYEERAWKGAADNGPIRNKSASGSVKNVYPQKGPYVAYYRKRAKMKERSVSNSGQLAKVRRAQKPRTGGSQGQYYPASVSAPYIQKGKKNVYWGKLQKKESPYTNDITGGPLRTRNYKSTPAGLVGRDTVRTFGKKPMGDRTSRVGGGGYATATKKGQRGWKGDVSGWRLRKSAKGKGEVAGKFVFPRKLSISGKSEGRGQGGPGGGYKTRTRRGEKAQLNSIPNVVYDRDLSGKVKGVKRPKGGGSVSAGWNNSGQPIRGRGPGFGSVGAARFSGDLRQDQARRVFSGKGPGYAGNIKKSSFVGFGRDGTNYSGNIKRSSIRGYSREGTGYSGNIKSSGVRGYTREGVDYSGNIKRSTQRGFGRDGIDYSGNIKRSTIRGFGREGVDYSGNIKRSTQRGFGREGVNYSGNIKRSTQRGFGREGVDYSGNIKRSTLRGFGSEGVDYSGNIKRSSQRGFGREGVDYSGNIKRSSQRGFGRQGVDYSGNIERVGPIKQFGEAGVTSSGNIRRSSVRGFGREGAGYSGNIRMKRPEKGGGSVSGRLWNNNNQAIPTKPFSAAGADFSGRTKSKKPEKGGGSVSGQLWNNDNKPIAVKTPPNDNANYSGRIALPRLKKSYIQNDNASKESLLKKRPDETTYRVSGLQIKVLEHNYKKKPNASPDAMPGIAPTRSSVKASEYARSMKQYWHYKQNPNSADGALKGIAPGKAMARIGDYQGNVKMHKYTGSRLHPDAQFAHGYRDNVKEERTVMMNVKLLWGKLFRKSETQPENLKEKIRRPRYDKKEKGLWNE